jgi:hypothetical protein
MPDDPTKRGGADRQRIDASQGHEMKHWTKKLGVSADRLKNAIKDVGDRADKITEHLRVGGDRKLPRRARKR